MWCRKGLWMLCLIIGNHAAGQLAVLAVIKAGVTKAIQALDLKVQRLQNEELALEVIEKQQENQMVAQRLHEIQGWVNGQQALYADWYSELLRPSPAILKSSRLNAIEALCENLVTACREYRQATSMDPHFSPAEQKYIAGVYAEKLSQAESWRVMVNQLITPAVTRMPDAGRLELLAEASRQMRLQLADMNSFFEQNRTLSLQRSRDSADLVNVERLYGTATQ